MRSLAGSNRHIGRERIPDDYPELPEAREQGIVYLVEAISIKREAQVGNVRERNAVIKWKGIIRENIRGRDK